MASLRTVRRGLEPRNWERYASTTVAWRDMSERLRLVTTPFGSFDRSVCAGSADQGARVLRLTRATLKVPTGARRGLGAAAGVSDRKG